MSEEAVQLFLDSLGELQRRMGGAAEEAPAAGDEAAAATGEGSRQQRGAWFREDLLTVLGDPRLAETWDPERLSSEEVFTTYVHVAEAYLRGAEVDRRPYLRGLMAAIRDMSEAPEYIRHILPLVIISPGDRWALLAHGGIHAGAVTEDPARWPITPAEVDEIAARLTHTDADPGASWHVKHLKDLGLVTVSKKPRLYSQLEHEAKDLWLFVKLTEEAQRFLATIGFR